MRRLLVIAAAVGCANNDDVPPPHVGAILPDQAPATAIVELDGMYFCQLPSTGSDDQPVVCDIGTVSFGTTPGTVSTWTDEQIMVEVPHGAAMTMSVTVTAHGRTSNGIAFTRTD